MSEACPRCKQAFTSGHLSKVPVAACEPCNGTLVAQLDLIRLLEGLSSPLLARFAVDTQLEAVPDASARVDCPRCARRMYRDDYCGAGLVSFDRCTKCNVLWFDSEELGGMTLMWARMNARQARTQEVIRDAIPSIDPLSTRMVGRGLLGLAVWSAFIL